MAKDLLKTLTKSGVAKHPKQSTIIAAVNTSKNHHRKGTKDHAETGARRNCPDAIGNRQCLRLPAFRLKISTEAKRQRQNLLPRKQIIEKGRMQMAYDLSKLNIRDGRIFYKVRQQDDRFIEMDCSDTTSHRHFVQWVQIHD